jgi:hypothetical protein
MVMIKKFCVNDILVYESAKQKEPNRWTGKTRNWIPVETVSLNPAKVSIKEAA